MQHPIDLQKIRKSLGVLSVSGGVHIIIREPDWVRDLIGHLINMYVNAEL